MIAFRTSLALACVSATALAGHGGYYDDLSYGHGSLLGYGVGGMSYGLNYGKRATGGYGKTLISRPQIVHGLGLSQAGLGQHGLNFGGYGQDIAVPSAGIAKGYGSIGQDLGHYGGEYGAGYAVGYGKAISGPISGASIGIGKGYGDLPLLGGYGSLAAAHPGKALPAPATIVKEYSGSSLSHGYGTTSLGHGLGSAGLGYGYKNIGLGHAYQGVGLGHAYGSSSQKFVDYGKGLTAPLTIQKSYASAYGDELGYGVHSSAPFVSNAYGAAHGTPVYSGIVKAGVPVSLARKW